MLEVQCPPAARDHRQSRPGASGIITVDADPGGARRARGRRAHGRHATAHNHDALAVEGHADDAERQHVGLHQRAAPIIHMLKDSQADGKDVIWGAK